MIRVENGREVIAADIWKSVDSFEHGYVIAKTRMVQTADGEKQEYVVWAVYKESGWAGIYTAGHGGYFLSLDEAVKDYNLRRASLITT